MLAEAKRECDRLIGEAREQAVREASQTEIVKIAERQAQDIVDDARRQARETRLEMEDWADGILSSLEVNLDKFLVAVRRGRERLHERSQETVMSGHRPDRPGRPAGGRRLVRVEGRCARSCESRPSSRLGREQAATADLNDDVPSAPAPPAPRRRAPRDGRDRAAALRSRGRALPARARAGERHLRGPARDGRRCLPARLRYAPPRAVHALPARRGRGRRRSTRASTTRPRTMRRTISARSTWSTASCSSPSGPATRSRRRCHPRSSAGATAPGSARSAARI